ncbi:MAG: cyclic nucleotide-binding domain-containing protein [Magnetococcales bacterium]|nr:cyclic nucleotide-binding domain-containing protein [Magnetococcales bacterium]
MWFSQLFARFRTPSAGSSIHTLFSQQEKQLGRRYAKGEMIIREGATDHFMYYIQNGAVEVFKQRLDQKETHLTRLEQGEIFGEMALFDDAPRWASVRAASDDTRVLTLDARALLRHLHEDPFLLLTILRKLIDRLKRMNRLYNQLTREQIAASTALSELTRLHRQPEDDTPMTGMVTQLAERIRAKGVYPEEINGGMMEHLELACLLLDVGEEGVEQDILEKKTGLTSHELHAVRQHATIGAQVLAKAAIRRPEPALELAAEVAEFHHEHFDGQGYHGLHGQTIPLSARIIAVVDTYHALLADRPHRQGVTPEEALAMIQRESGSHFDPVVVEAFLEMMQESA